MSFFMLHKHEDNNICSLSHIFMKLKINNMYDFYKPRTTLKYRICIYKLDINIYICIYKIKY